MSSGSPERAAHDPDCLYRILLEAEEFVRRASSALRVVTGYLTNWTRHPYEYSCRVCGAKSNLSPGSVEHEGDCPVVWSDEVLRQAGEARGRRPKTRRS